jgi:hypothetical protein
MNTAVRLRFGHQQKGYVRGMKIIRTVSAIVGTMALVGFSYAGEACCGKPVSAADDAKTPAVAPVEVAKDAPAIKPQTKCPVMGGDIVKDVFVDVKGYRIYMCCKGCIGKIQAEPDKYIEKIKASGETPEASPACAKCKEPLGSDKCCKK